MPIIHKCFKSINFQNQLHTKDGFGYTFINCPSPVSIVAFSRGKTVPGFFPVGDHFTSVMSLKIGRYIAITINPIVPPIKTISSGSIMDVRLDTAISTSSS